MTDEEYDPVSEAREIVDTATPFDLKYREPTVVELSCISPIFAREWVAVAAWGDKQENGGDHETWCVRLGMQTAREGSEPVVAEAYLTFEEAEAVRDALAQALDKARSFP